MSHRTFGDFLIIVNAALFLAFFSGLIDAIDRWETNRYWRDMRQ